MACVTSVNYAILVNESPTEFSSASSGSCQECSVSPLLFLLIIEGLSRLISKEKEDGNLKGIKFGSKLSISHLLFVDDVMIFDIGSVQEWSCYNDLIQLFCMVTGMAINLNESI